MRRAVYIRLALPSWFHIVRKIAAVKLLPVAPSDHQRAPSVRWHG